MARQWPDVPGNAYQVALLRGDADTPRGRLASPSSFAQASDPAPPPAPDVAEFAHIKADVLRKLGPIHPKTYFQRLRRFDDGTVCGQVILFNDWGEYKEGRNLIYGFEEPDFLVIVEMTSDWEQIWCSNRLDKLSAHWDARFNRADRLCWYERGKHASCGLAADHRRRYIAERQKEIAPSLAVWARLCAEVTGDKPQFDHRCLRAQDLKKELGGLNVIKKEVYPPASYTKRSRDRYGR